MNSLHTRTATNCNWRISLTYFQIISNFGYTGTWKLIAQGEEWPILSTNKVYFPKLQTSVSVSHLALASVLLSHAKYIYCRMQVH